MAYQAVRLLNGDIRPEQFLTGVDEEGGFFDALANGRLSQTNLREPSFDTEGPDR